MTLRAGVVGSPARHSLSPLIHGAWLTAAGVDGVYELFDIAPDGFQHLADHVRALGFTGLNVTLPFKEEALAAAHTRSERADAAGAANLLIFAEGRIQADNTDGLGLLYALETQAGFDPAGAIVALIGAGGAGRGAAAALVAAGAGEVRIVNRTRARADELARALGPRVTAFSEEQAQAALHGAALLVNATSLGLNGDSDLEAPLDALAKDAVVMDMVYKPLETGLIRAAKARGFRTADGLQMLIGQAIPSFEAFYGFPPPALDVRTLALKALNS